MWHHAKYISFFIAYACDVQEGTIWIAGCIDCSIGITILVNDLMVVVDLLQCFIIGMEPALTVGDRDFQWLFFLSDDMYIFTNELLVGVFQ